MADNVAVTAGSGTTIATDDVGGVQFQRVKLDIGGDGVSVPVPGDATNGVDVDVTRVAGVAQLPAALISGRLDVNIGASAATVPVSGTVAITAAALPLPSGAATQTTLAAILVDVDKIPAIPASEHILAASPHSVRLSDGSAFVAPPAAGQLPAALVGGRLSVDVGAAAIAQLPAALIGGRLPVDIGASVTLTVGGTNLTVNAPVATPVFVRLSDGSAAIGALPVTDNGSSLTVDGAVTVSGTATVSAAVAAPVFVRLSDGAAAIATLPVSDAGGSLTVDGTVAISGTVAATQSGVWANKLTDGTNNATLTTVGADFGLDVNIIGGTGLGSVVDKAAFVEGTGLAAVVAGVRNDAISADPAEDTAAALRITAKRGLHVTLHSAAGVEQGTSAAPVYVKGNGAFASVPVDLTCVAGSSVVTAGAGIQQVGIVHGSGQAFTVEAPLFTCPGLHTATLRRATLTWTASQTDIALLTPTGGTRLVLLNVYMKVTGAGTFNLFDAANTAFTQFVAGTYAIADEVSEQYPSGSPTGGDNQVLRYTSGAGSTGTITVLAYEI